MSTLYMNKQTGTVMQEMDWIDEIGVEDFEYEVETCDLVEVIEDGHGWYTEV